MCDIEKDADKRKLCRDKGISLIEIPYWWNEGVDNLRGIVAEHRPELVTAPPSFMAES